MKKTVLIFDSDPIYGALLKAFFDNNGYLAHWRRDYRYMDQQCQLVNPDLIFLSAELSRIEELLPKASAASNAAIIILSEPGEESDVVNALESGAEDYIIRSQRMREILARSNTVLRRRNEAQPEVVVYRHEELRVGCNADRAWIEDEAGREAPLSLTATELRLLSVLLRNPRKAFSRGELLEVGRPCSQAFERVIDTHVHRLKRKLKTKGVHGVINSVRSIGYRFI